MEYTNKLKGFTLGYAWERHFPPSKWVEVYVARPVHGIQVDIGVYSGMDQSFILHIRKLPENFDPAEDPRHFFGGQYTLPEGLQTEMKYDTLDVLMMKCFIEDWISTYEDAFRIDATRKVDINGSLGFGA